MWYDNIAPRRLKDEHKSTRFCLPIIFRYHYGKWRYNYNWRLTVALKWNTPESVGVVVLNQWYLFPSLMLIKFFRVDSFRCFGHMVVVRCTSDELFYFGQLCQDEVIKEPRQVTEYKHGRDVFQTAKYRATGGLVCMGVYWVYWVLYFV